MGGYRFISLSKSEEQEIRSLMSQGCSPQESCRLESLLLSNLGIDISSISKSLDVHVNTIGKWFDRWEYEGMAGIMNRPKSGRPRTFSPEEEKKLQTLP